MLESIVFLIVGLLVGAVLGWLVVRLRATQEAGRRALAEQQLAQREAQLEQAENQRREIEQQNRELGERITDLTGRLHTNEAQAQRVGALEAELREVGARAQQTGEELMRLRTTLEEERKAAEEKQALLEEARVKLSDAFKALASEALSHNSKSFLELARENFAKEQTSAKGELEKRQQAIGELVKPLQEQLKNYETHLREIETLRSKAYGELLQQVKTLDQNQQLVGSETRRLVEALRAPKTRGRWGELALRNAVELAGMADHCDFEMEVSTATEEGRLRPDMIVNLPGGRRIVIDAKTTMQAYLEAIEAEDTETRNRALRRHADQLSKQVDLLAQKNYWAQFDPAPDFVVLFIPAESFLGPALEFRPDLIERGFERRVVLATPTTLISILRTVALSWREEQLTRHAQTIRDHGQELYERLATFAESLGKLGGSLATSVNHYNRAVGSLESRVLVTARKFPELGIPSGKEMAELTPVEAMPRPLTSPEAVNVEAEEAGEAEGASEKAESEARKRIEDQSSDRAEVYE